MSKKLWLLSVAVIRKDWGSFEKKLFWWHPQKFKDFSDYIDTNLGNSGFDMLKAFNNQFCMNSNASYLFWSTQKYSKVYLLFAVDAYFPTACLDSPSFPVWFIVLILPLNGVTCLIVWYPDIVTRDLPAIVPGCEGCILHSVITFPLFL